VASLAEVVAFQSAIGHLTTLTIADLVAFWRGLDTEDAASSAQAVREFLPDLLDTYASLSAELGAAFYDESRDAAGVRGSFVADPVVIPPGDRAQSMISWGIAPLFRGASVRDLVGTGPDPDLALSRLSGGSQLMVAEGARETIADNVDKDPAKPTYARHASANACAFCSLIASRGAVYRTARSAGEGRKFHDHCHCVPVAVWPNEKYEPAPYVKTWEDAYRKSRRDGATDTKAILSNMRSILGVS
jgi:hypothetical protein